MSRRKTTKEFIEESKLIHGQKYDYSKVEYVGAHSKVCIICAEHGEFWQRPSDHLKGQGCSKCGGKYHWTTKEWIQEATNRNNNLYTYENTHYVDKSTKVIVTCPIHGDFKVIPYDHLCGHGCQKCTDKYHYTNDEWVEKARKVHFGKYDYSKTMYVNSKSKVCIICPKHGEFYQNAGHHLYGIGCSMCGNVSKLENKVKEILERKNVNYKAQKRFQWLGLQSLDFYLSDFNVGIECQGIQHFECKDYFGGNDGLLKIIKRDEIKINLCSENNVTLYYINYNDNIEEKLNEILEQIENGYNVKKK